MIYAKPGPGRKLWRGEVCTYQCPFLHAGVTCTCTCEGYYYSWVLILATLWWWVSKLIFAHTENDHFQFEGNRQPDMTAANSCLCTG